MDMQHMEPFGKKGHLLWFPHLVSFPFSQGQSMLAVGIRRNGYRDGISKCTQQTSLPFGFPIVPDAKDKPYRSGILQILLPERSMWPAVSVPSCGPMYLASKMATDRSVASNEEVPAKGTCLYSFQSFTVQFELHHSLSSPAPTPIQEQHSCWFRNLASRCIFQS